MFYELYLLDDNYNGITRRRNGEDIETAILRRRDEHVVQAIRWYATRKDRHVFNRLIETGDVPPVEHLFTSTWTDEQVKEQWAEWSAAGDDLSKYKQEDIMMRLAGQDEMAVSLLLRDTCGVDMLNIAAGTTRKNLSRVVAAPPTSTAFKHWHRTKFTVDKYLTTVTPTTLKYRHGTEVLVAARVKASAKNSVVWDDQETLAVVTVKNITSEYHKTVGPNTRMVYFDWHKGPDVYRYVDTFGVCADMVKGGDYLVFTQKAVAPDDVNTKVWDWSAHEVLNTDLVLRLLNDCLMRIEQVRDAAPSIANCRLLADLEHQTRQDIKTVQQDATEALPKVLSARRLVDYVVKG